MKTDRDILSDAIAEFPERFGLRAFPGKVFCIARVDSWVDRETKIPQLYVCVETDDGWLSFSRGTPPELAREIVARKG